MKKRLIDISKFSNEILVLRNLSYRTNSLENQIKFLLQNNLINYSNYNTLWEEYITYYVQCEKFKEYFIETKIFPMINEEISLDSFCCDFNLDEGTALICNGKV